MDALCYPLDVTTTEGDSPAALGNRIAAAVLAYGHDRRVEPGDAATTTPTTSR